MVWTGALLLLLTPDTAFYKEIEQAIQRGEYRAAIDRLSAEKERDSAWHLLASRAWDGLNEPARAVEEAENALRLDPNQLAFHLNLAQIFLSRNTPKAALEVLSEAEQLFPESFLIQLGKGLALKELQLYPEAEQELKKCLSRQPASALAYDALATVYLHQLRFDDLRTLSAAFLEHNPDDYRGYYFLAAGRDGSLLPEGETRRLLGESIHRNPGFAASHALLGKVWLREGKSAEAVQSLRRAVELRPDLVQAHLQLARALRLTGDKAGAAKHFEIVRTLKAKEQEPVPTLKYGRGSRPSARP